MAYQTMGELPAGATCSGFAQGRDALRLVAISPSGLFVAASPP